MSRIIKISPPVMSSPSGTVIPAASTSTGEFSARGELQQLLGSQVDSSLIKLGSQWQSLAQENHAEFFYGDLMTLGHQLEQSGDTVLAQRIWTTLQERAPAESLREVGRHHLAVLQGTGSLGDLLEFHSRSFLAQMTDPQIIVPMMTGSLAFQVGKTVAMARLTGGTGQAWWRSGVVARGSAAALGFTGEVGAFSLTRRGMDYGFNASDWGSLSEWGRELKTNALTLGLLKSFAFLGSQGVLHLRGLNELGHKATVSAGDRLFLSATGHASGYLGLVAAHSLETELGLRPDFSHGNLWLDALATHLALHAGGRLGRDLSGARLAKLQQNLGEQAQIYTEISKQARGFNFPLHMAMANVGSGGGGDFSSGGSGSGGASRGRPRRSTPVGLRIIQGVATAIPPGWSTIKPVSLWLHLNTGEISASRPTIGPVQKITLVHRKKNQQQGIWQSRWILTEESFKGLVKSLARNPKSPVGDVVTEAIKALGTTEQGIHLLQQTRDAKRKTGRLGSEVFQVPERVKGEVPVAPARTVTMAQDGTFKAIGVYHTIHGYVKVRPLASPEAAGDLKKVFRVQVNSPNMVGPFIPDPEGGCQIWLVPWGNVRQIEQGKTPKNPGMMRLQVKSAVPLKIGDWVEITETSQWQPRPYSAEVISPHYEGDVKLYALRDFSASSDPANTFRVQELREILDEGNRWDAERLILKPHQAWEKTLVPGEQYHPLEVLLTEQRFPVKRGDWVQVGGEWGPRALGGIGYAKGMRMRLNLYMLSGFDALAEGGESIFRVQGLTDRNTGVAGNLILVHHSMWGHSNAKKLFVSLERDVPLQQGDWVKLENLEDLSPPK